MEFPYLPFEFVLEGFWPLLVLAAIGVLTLVALFGVGAWFLFHHIQFV